MGMPVGIRNLGPITSNYTPHGQGHTFLGTFSADIYIQPNAPTFVSVLFLPSISLGPYKLPQMSKSGNNAERRNAKLPAEAGGGVG